MTFTQQERKQAAANFASQVRAYGYLDGLWGVDTRREASPPMNRLDYDAGYSDGIAAKDNPQTCAKGA